VCVCVCVCVCADVYAGVEAELVDCKPDKTAEQEVVMAFVDHKVGPRDLPLAQWLRDLSILEVVTAPVPMTWEWRQIMRSAFTTARDAVHKVLHDEKDSTKFAAIIERYKYLVNNYCTFLGTVCTMHNAQCCAVMGCVVWPLCSVPRSDAPPVFARVLY
jgi:hypothetical protein